LGDVDGITIARARILLSIADDISISDLKDPIKKNRKERCPAILGHLIPSVFGTQDKLTTIINSL